MADDVVEGKGPEDGAAPVPPKMRLNLSRPPTNGKKPETSRIDLSAAAPPDVAPPGAEPLNVREVLTDSPVTAVRLPGAGTEKSHTSRISIHDSQPVPPGEAVPMAKAATQRIPLRESQPIAGAGAEVVPKAVPAKRATSQIQTEGITAPAAAADAAAQGALGRTARIIIDETETGLPTGGSLGDTGKMVIPPEAAAKVPPKTVRLTRPTAGAPKTIVLKRTDAPSAPPKTIVLRRPDAAALATPTVAPPSQGPHTVAVQQLGAGSSLEEKGATARISIPESALDTAAPPTRRKTIRIKRSDGAPASAARTVVLPRPSAPRVAAEEGAPAGMTPQIELEEALGVSGQREPGVGYAIVAILTFLVMGGVLYALLAQTYFPNWPLPGKVL